MRLLWNKFYRQPRLRYAARILLIWGISKLVWLAIPHLFWTDEVQFPILYPLAVGYVMGWSFQLRVGVVSGWRILSTSTVTATLVVLFDMLVVNLWSLMALGRLDMWLGDLFGIMLMIAGIIGAVILSAVGSAAGLVPAYLVPHPDRQAQAAPQASAA